MGGSELLDMIDAVQRSPLSYAEEAQCTVEFEMITKAFVEDETLQGFDFDALEVEFGKRRPTLVLFSDDMKKHAGFPEQSFRSREELRDS